VLILVMAYLSRELADRRKNTSIGSELSQHRGSLSIVDSWPIHPKKIKKISLEAKF
jgi:hypothetical protein